MIGGGSAAGSKAVARNTVWFALEQGVAVAGAFLTSIPLARVVGPDRLGDFMYLSWLMNISSQFAMAGTPVTTRKFMADFLATGDPDMAWSVLVRSLRHQVWLALFLLVSGGLGLLLLLDRDYRTVGFLLLGNAIIKIISCVFSAANMASERIRLNTMPSAVSTVASVVLINLSLYVGWDLTGVAAATLAASLVEFLLKLRGVLGWLPARATKTVPQDLHFRMRRFSGMNIVLLVLNLVVWDRSDLLFLRMLNSDPRQLAFFGLAFNLADKILVIPRSFVSAVSVRIMAQFGKQQDKSRRVLPIAARYGLLVTVPVMFGLAAVAPPLITLAYGSQYLPVITLLMISSLLGAAKPLLAPIQSLLLSDERQHLLIGAGIASAILNITLDLLLIPRSGAMGAIVANGVAQAVMVVGLWIASNRIYQLKLDWWGLGKVVLCGAGMGCCVQGLGYVVPEIMQLALGIPLGALVYLILIRVTGLLDSHDGQRMQMAVGDLRGTPGRLTMKVLTLLTSGNSPARP